MAAGYDVCHSRSVVQLEPNSGLLRNSLVLDLPWNTALMRTEGWLLKVPVFRTIYAPVKQLIAAFSPDNASGFKRVVLVEDPRRGYALGFLTREFTVDRGRGPEELLAVYVPTNNLYLGDVVICERDRVVFPDITVEEGIRILLTGGMALPPRLRI